MQKRGIYRTLESSRPHRIQCECDYAMNGSAASEKHATALAATVSDGARVLILNCIVIL